MSPLCKIKWLQQNEPQLFSLTAKFVSIKEYIWYQLFGEYVVDHSLASATGLFNVHSLQWEDPALSFAGISAEQLSLPVPVTYSRKGLKGSTADELGLPEDITFFAGASDGCLANLGSGCLSSSEAAITIGTSAAVRITHAKPVQAAGKMIFNYRLDEQTFVCGGATNNGGNVFQWLLNGLFNGHATIKDYDALFDAIASVPPGSRGLLFLPYLHGERAPIWDERSSGSFLGANASHNLLHFARSAAEGVCYALNHILSSLEEQCGTIRQLYVSGGLVQSPVMMQLLANVTGKKVVVLQTEDASAIGAIYLAQKALGWISSYTDLPRKEAQVFDPVPEDTKLYGELFTLYRSLYPVVKPIMHSIYQLTD